MKINEIMATALRLLGRGDIAEAIAKGEPLTGEAEHTADTLLYCVNAVLDELARYYFPLARKEIIYFSGGKAAFADFEKIPVKILNVTSGGKKIGYEISPKYLTARAAQAEVEYEYTPGKAELGGECEYAGYAVGERLVADGAAAEYCILNGEVKEAEYWEGEYRREIDRARAKSRKGLKIPPRRWV